MLACRQQLSIRLTEAQQMVMCTYLIWIRFVLPNDQAWYSECRSDREDVGMASLRSRVGTGKEMGDELNGKRTGL